MWRCEWCEVLAVLLGLGCKNGAIGLSSVWLWAEECVERVRPS